MAAAGEAKSSGQGGSRCDELPADYAEVRRGEALCSGRDKRSCLNVVRLSGGKGTDLYPYVRIYFEVQDL